MAEPQDRPDIQVFTEIGIIEHLTRTHVTRQLPPGMTYTHFEVLLHMSRMGDGQTPAEMAEAMQLTKGAITNALQKMEAKGWIVVLADVADGRKKRIKLTRAGLDAKSEVMRRNKPYTDNLRDGFTESEFRDALPFLKALRAFLGDMRSDDRADGQRAARDADNLDCSA